MKLIIKITFLFIFFFSSKIAFSQVELVSWWSTPVDSWIGHSLYPSSSLNTPTCLTYRLDGVSRGLHWAPGSGEFTSVDSGATWSGTYYQGHDNGGGPIITSNTYTDHYEDTIVKVTYNIYGYALSRSYDCGLTWNNYFGPLSSAPEIFSMYSGSYGYGLNSNGQLIQIDHDSAYQLPFNAPINSQYASLIKFTNDSIGYIMDLHSLYKTSNGGANWNLILADTIDSFYQCSFINDSTFFIAKSNYIYSKTTNSGNAWVDINFHRYIGNISGTHPDTLVGLYTPSYVENLSYPYNYFMRSYDGGLTWDSLVFIPDYIVMNFNMFNRNLGYALARRTLQDQGYYTFHIHTGVGFVSVGEVTEFIQPGNAFPNPFSNEFKISGWSSGTMQMFDACGRMVFESKINKNEQSFDPDIPKGFYLLKLVDGNKQRVLRLVH